MVRCRADSLLAVNFHGLRRLLLLRGICGLGLLLSCGDEMLGCSSNMRVSGSGMVDWGSVMGWGGVVGLGSEMGWDGVVCWGGVVHWGSVDRSLVLGGGCWVGNCLVRSIMLHRVGNKLLNLGLRCLDMGVVRNGRSRVGAVVSNSVMCF